MLEQISIDKTDEFKSNASLDKLIELAETQTLLPSETPRHKLYDVSDIGPPSGWGESKVAEHIQIIKQSQIQQSIIQALWNK